jgi:hypothetical protein
LLHTAATFRRQRCQAGYATSCEQQVCSSAKGKPAAMGDLISHVIDAPIPNLCVISGLVFLAIAVLGNISGRIEPGNAGRIAAAVLGSVLFVYGVVKHSHMDSESRQDTR